MTEVTTRRLVGLGALLLAVLLVVIVLLGSGGPYRVTALFESSSQLVKGNNVTVAGEPVGSVTEIGLTDDGQARVELEIEEGYAPLRRGTTATVRLTSLSGVANRYVDLMLAPDDAPAIEDGGVLPASDTRAAVDLDQLFNTFGPEVRKATQRDIEGFAEMFEGNTERANDFFRYLSPATYAARRLFGELSRNEPAFERFVTETAGLMGDLGARREELAGLVSNLARTSSALADRRGELAESIGRLPTFLRTSNITFVNLRGALDDLDPLVEAGGPAARRLRPLFAALRPFARDARPTVRALSRTIRRPGRRNDLIELLRAQPALDRAANDSVEANGRRREGAFPATTRALATATPELAFARPYAVDLTGWFDDFSTSGAYDALGNFSRAGLGLTSFTFTPALNIVPVPPALRDDVLAAGAQLGRSTRCPGSVERPAPDGSNPYRPSDDYPCDPTQVPIGP